MSGDMNRRIRHEVFDECHGRFVSEYGVIGPCHLDSIREYLGSEEIRLQDPAGKCTPTPLGDRPRRQPFASTTPIPGT